MPPTFFDRISEWLWATVVVIFGWAWAMDRRVTKLEVQSAAAILVASEIRSDLKLSNDKLDRLIDRLL